MPDYIALTKFLVEPLLDNPDALRVDCETNAKGDRIWVRLAFAQEDKGRAFGRGGRTIQAIRALVSAAAQTTGQELRFDVFDPNPSDKSGDRDQSSYRDNSERMRPKQDRTDRDFEAQNSETDAKPDRPRLPAPVKRKQPEN